MKTMKTIADLANEALVCTSITRCFTKLAFMNMLNSQAAT